RVVPAAGGATSAPPASGGWRGGRRRPSEVAREARRLSGRRHPAHSHRGKSHDTTRGRLGGIGALLTQELLDLRDEVRRRRKLVARGKWLHGLVLVGRLPLELADVLGDLCVLADDLVQVLVELP